MEWCAYGYINICICPHTHIHTHARTYACTHTHTNTHLGVWMCVGISSKYQDVHVFPPVDFRLSSEGQHFERFVALVK
jgi:hypothetical protein